MALQSAPELSKEKLDEIMKKLSPADKQKVETVLKDPELTKKIFSTPEAQALYKKFTGDK